MKFKLTFALLCLVSIAWAQNSEENAIKETLQAETKAFMNRDYEGWANHWDQDGSVSFLVTGVGMQENSWGAISTSMKSEMENNPEKLTADLQTSDYTFSIDGNQAFVTYIQNWKAPNYESKSHEIRNMRKVNGHWKVASMVSSPLTYEQTEQNVMINLESAVRMLYDMNKLEEGVKVAKTMTELYPNSISGHWGQGAIYIKMKDKENAIIHLEKAISIEPDNTELKDLYEEARKL